MSTMLNVVHSWSADLGLPWVGFGSDAKKRHGLKLAK